MPRKKFKQRPAPLLTRENKKVWAEHEKNTRAEIEERLRAAHGDAWMEANRARLDFEWELTKDLVL